MRARIRYGRSVFCAGLDWLALTRKACVRERRRKGPKNRRSLAKDCFAQNFPANAAAMWGGLVLGDRVRNHRTVFEIDSRRIGPEPASYIIAMLLQPIITGSLDRALETNHRRQSVQAPMPYSYRHYSADTMDNRTVTPDDFTDHRRAVGRL